MNNGIQPEIVRSEMKLKIRRPTKLDWFIYSIFRMWWNPIFRSAKSLSLALAREINAYWARQQKFIGSIKDHRHEFYLDAEIVFTDDGDPQPRQSIFMECFSGDKHRDCSFFLRDHEIIDYINKLIDNKK